MANVIVDKSFLFAVQIVRVCRKLSKADPAHVLSLQLLRSGTSIGANVEEAQQAQSRKDFVSKLGIALKEANETAYWLRLLRASGYSIEQTLFEQCSELIRLLTAIIKRTKEAI